MMSVVTWYDVLGVVPGATTDDIREAWQERQAALQPGRLAGAPSEVQSAADRARQAVAEAWRVLADPAARAAYDQDAGFHRPGEGLGPPSETPGEPGVSLSEGWSLADEEALEPYPDRTSHVVVPDVAGLVVGQQPDPGKRVHRDSTLTVQVWHPPEPGR